jgi:hypothetical protein
MFVVRVSATEGSNVCAAVAWRLQCINPAAALVDRVQPVWEKRGALATPLEPVLGGQIDEVTGRPRFHLQSEVEDVVCGKQGGVLCMVLVYCVSTWQGDCQVHSTFGSDYARVGDGWLPHGERVDEHRTRFVRRRVL